MCDEDIIMFVKESFEEYIDLVKLTDKQLQELIDRFRDKHFVHRRSLPTPHTSKLPLPLA